MTSYEDVCFSCGLPICRASQDKRTWIHVATKNMVCNIPGGGFAVPQCEGAVFRADDDTDWECTRVKGHLGDCDYKLVRGTPQEQPEPQSEIDQLKAEIEFLKADNNHLKARLHHAAVQHGANASLCSDCEALSL